jgi:predicted dehydrogenase
MGGGVVLDLIHEIDYARWLFGDLESVKAHVGSVSALDIETEDIAEIICRTTNGAIGRIHQDYFRRRPKRRLEVVCSDGVVEADIQNHTVDWTTLGDEHHRSFDYERNERFRRQFEYFLEHVKTDTPCENDVATGKRVLQTALNVRGELNDR